MYESDTTAVDRAVDLALRKRAANENSKVVVQSGYFQGGANDPGSGNNPGGGVGSTSLETVSVTIAAAATEIIAFGEYRKVFFTFSYDDDADKVEGGWGVVLRNNVGDKLNFSRNSGEVVGDGTGQPAVDWAVSLSGDDLQLEITNNEAVDLLVTLTIVGRHT